MRVTNLLKVLRETRGDRESKMAANAEMLSGSKDPLTVSFTALLEKRFISSRNTRKPSRSPMRCINRRRSRRHCLGRDRPNPARRRFLSLAQDSESPCRSLYRLGRRYSNLAPDLSALRHTHPCIVRRVSELRHPKLV